MASGEEQRANSGGGARVAFPFSSTMIYPPIFHNIKVHYVSQEMKRRGLEVYWVHLGGRERSWVRDGIRFVTLHAPRRAHLYEALRILRFILFCAVSRIQLVYMDEWLFLRKGSITRLVCQMILRRMGVKVVLDQRDPYLDFELAAGEVKEGTSKHKFASLMRPLLIRQTDLIVLPSEAYSELYRSEGVPERKLIGMFRGIDTGAFRFQAGASAARTKLGLDGRFVIGWFGIMHSFRMIKEVIVPLIQNLSNEMPNAHFLVGGEGPLLEEFIKLQHGPASGSFNLLGTIPYTILPEYLAACDVTICPVNTDYRLSMYSNWLKIAESISVGTPVVATRTETSRLDYRDMKGVVWVGSDYQSFLRALLDVQRKLGAIRAEAEAEAMHFEAYSILRTIPRIVDRILALLRS